MPQPQFISQFESKCPSSFNCLRLSAMRSSFLVFIAAAVLFSSCDVVSTATNTDATLPEIVPSPSVLSTDDVSSKNRHLRIRDDDESDDEERMDLDGKLAEKAASKLAKITQRTGVQADEELTKLVARWTQLKDQYMPLLKKMELQGMSPAQLAEKLQIDHKIATKTAAQLETDLDYQFYLIFQNFWTKDKVRRTDIQSVLL